MSRKERDRLTIMVGVKRKELTQVQAAELLCLSYRQTKRVWRRYQAQGDAGLVHRCEAGPSGRRKPPMPGRKCWRGLKTNDMWISDRP